MITLHLIHRNLISLHQHQYIVKNNGVENLENDQLDQMKKFDDTRAQQEAGSLYNYQLSDG